MIFKKTVKVTNRCMITLPAYLRKTFDFKDGDHNSIIEDEDGMKIIPIEDIKSLSTSLFYI